MSEEPFQSSEEVSEGAPLWVVTFGDLMSLLLCFFVLLLSFSETDRNKYKEVAGSMANADRFAHQYNERKIAEALDPIREEFGESEALELDLEVLKTMYEMSGESGF